MALLDIILTRCPVIWSGSVSECFTEGKNSIDVKGTAIKYVAVGGNSKLCFLDRASWVGAFSLKSPSLCKRSDQLLVLGFIKPFLPSRIKLILEFNVLNGEITYVELTDLDGFIPMVGSILLFMGSVWLEPYGFSMIDVEDSLGIEVGAIGSMSIIGFMDLKDVYFRFSQTLVRRGFSDEAFLFDVWFKMEVIEEKVLPSQHVGFFCRGSVRSTNLHTFISDVGAEFQEVVWKGKDDQLFGILSERSFNDLLNVIQNVGNQMFDIMLECDAISSDHIGLILWPILAFVKMSEFEELRIVERIKGWTEDLCLNDIDKANVGNECPGAHVVWAAVMFKNRDNFDEWGLQLIYDGETSWSIATGKVWSLKNADIVLGKWSVIENIELDFVHGYLFREGMYAEAYITYFPVWKSSCGVSRLDDGEVDVVVLCIRVRVVMLRRMLQVAGWKSPLKTDLPGFVTGLQAKGLGTTKCVNDFGQVIVLRTIVFMMKGNIVQCCISLDSNCLSVAKCSSRNKIQEVGDVDAEDAGTTVGDMATNLLLGKARKKLILRILGCEPGGSTYFNITFSCITIL